MEDKARTAELNIRIAIVILISASITAQAQSGSTDRVLNVPYSAKRHFIETRKLADGTFDHEESGGSEARDSQGRTFSAGERHWTYFDGKANVLGSEMLYRIDDPVANTETKWETTSKVVKVIHWTQQASSGDGPAKGCPAECNQFLMEPPSDVVEKLGVKTIGGFVAEGTRSSYTVPAGGEHDSQQIRVVHERWYCPELRIVILETNDDPRTGITRNELIDIIRGEPDATQYRPPADYVVRDIQSPL